MTEIQKNSLVQFTLHHVNSMYIHTVRVYERFTRSIYPPRLRLSMALINSNSTFVEIGAIGYGMSMPHRSCSVSQTKVVKIERWHDPTTRHLLNLSLDRSNGESKPCSKLRLSYRRNRIDNCTNILLDVLRNVKAVFSRHQKIADKRQAAIQRPGVKRSKL